MDEQPTDSGPFRLLFVCTGNTCRSPMAEAIARSRLQERGWRHVAVGSAGVAASPQRPASDGAVRAAAARGFDLNEHRATLLTQEVADDADLILTMSVAHLARVVELGAEGRGALITMFGHDPSQEPSLVGVPDPFGGSDEEYIETFDALERLVDQVLQALEPVILP